ncbi:MAG TPA: polyprenyl diphosphate synthase [Propionicimonas sp.]|nr:polyprenyl diphosphate synthase [Propionicimonas sp.]HQA77820.1 polyprenyl diphosphate synthase [Propionicimonas sp.]HQD96771.1 polyprenyl diphosphate synthase [Propionicimonas sp.]
MSLGLRVREAVNRLQPLGFLYSAYETQLLAQLDRSALPQHVAVLADGNRRWARANAPEQPLVVGYQAGADKLRQFVDWCADLGIGVVTLWVLSTENLTRSESDEVAPLLNVIEHLVAQLATQYRVKVVGDLNLLPEQMAQNLHDAEANGERHSGIHVNVAIAYGGRHELRDAVRSLLATEAAKGTTLDQLADTLEIDHISEHLYTAGQPDPDLVIRTSGEQRMSGFLIWQSAHSEFYFCEALWPDFRKVDFIRALRSYAQRERRYGR